MRLRITFNKTEALRYSGHLDLFRAWERTFRRAGLPLAYSQGYNPQPRINLASALPLGITSECESLDVWLESDLLPGVVHTALERALPPGLSITSVEEVEQNAPAIQTQVSSAEYTLTLLDPLPEIDELMEKILSSETLPRLRRGKSYDLRPFIEQLQRLPDDDQGRIRLQVLLAAREGATGRPDELLAVLNLQPYQSRIHRTKLIYAFDVRGKIHTA